MLRVLLLFPIAVVTLAFAAFAFGGHCALWQWWLAAAFAIATGFWRRPAREGIRAGLLFLAWMAIAWVGCGLAAAPNWYDEAGYHLPAVRMLADGWNPLLVNAPEELLRLTGFAPTDFRVDHVLFMPKIVWVFSAVAYFFTNDLFNPLVPILWFLVPAVLMRIWRTMENAAIVWKVLVIPLLYCLLLGSAYVVDIVIQLAAIGLLLSFEEALSGKRVDVLSLVAYSFWMMGVKTTGLFHGGFFWTIFLVFAFVKKMDWRPLAKVVAGVSVLLAVTCSTPYFTSICHYRHPFYPNYTFDEKRFPVRDITEDFITCQNEDAASIGHFGKYVYSFIAPSLVRTWYRWRLQKPDFQPYSANYRHHPNDGDGSVPTRWGMRFAFWVTIALLFFAGRKSFRPIMLMIVLGIGVAPLPMIGYVRYVPWWLLPILFLYIDLTCDGGRRRRMLACLVLLGAFSIRPYTLPRRLCNTAKLVEDRLLLRQMLDGDRPFSPIRPTWPPSVAYLKMMRQRFPVLARAELLPYSAPLADGLREEGVELPGKLFVFADVDETRRLANRIPKGVCDRVNYLLRATFVMLPRATAERIASLWHDDGTDAKKKGEGS